MTLVSSVIAQNTMIVEFNNGEKIEYKTDDIAKVYFGTAEVVAQMEWVDLGLPSGLLWAAYNLGANTPEEYGNYYLWGDPQPFGGSNPGMSLYGVGESELYNRGIINSNYELTPKYDAATVALGEGCRMPTGHDLEELKENSTWEWEQLNGITGIRFTSKRNDKSIFLPAGGTIDTNSDPTYFWLGNLVEYWTSTASGSCSIDLFLPTPDRDNYGYNGGNFVNLTSFRNHACPIRAVR